MSERGTPRRGAGPRSSRWVLAAVPAALGLFVAAQYPQLFRVPFHGDDFVFLARTRDASFAALWGTAGAPFGYFRPWSRELHYWIHQHLFGAQETGFHLTSLALWLTAMGLYFAIVRRVAGAVAAPIATAAVAALTAWAAPLNWIAGAQDLWMLAAALGALFAWGHGRVALATVLFGIALLSKETAIALPLVAIAYDRIVTRRSLRDTLLRAVPLLVVALLWALAHPRLGGHLFSGTATPVGAPNSHPLSAVARTLASAIDLDQWPRPSIGWGPALQRALIGTLVLGGLAALGSLARANRAPAKIVPSETRREHRRGPTLAFAGAWTAAGILPLLAPGIGWQAYYGLFAVMGMWLAFGTVLAVRPAVAVSVVACLTLIGGARTFTRSAEWGSPWYQNRASNFVRGTREWFEQTHPALAPHTRVFLSNVPNDVGLIAGNRSPVLAVWYGDTTLSAAFASSFLPRATGEPAGQDLFFAYDTLSGWHVRDSIGVAHRVSGGATTSPSTGAAGSAEDREAYATAIFQTGRYREAGDVFRRLSEEHPDRYDWIFNVGTCYLRMGDSTEAARWYVRAAAFQEAPAGMKRVGEKYLRFLR